jgi:hypothetical protein
MRRRDFIKVVYGQRGDLSWRCAMHIRSIIVVSGAIVLMAASAALSKDGVLPQLDVQKQCRATQKATDDLTGTKNPDAFDLCIRSEQSAREKLVARWATIPPSDKTGCIRPADWSASYSEWLGCVDTRVYVRTMREKNPTSMPASKLCPTVNWQSDGSITNVVACHLR